MYWYKLPKPTTILSTAACFALVAGCKPEVRQNGSPQFFDIKKYFTAEASRLTSHNALVLKTVEYKKETEKQTILIKNWQHELALFTSSDINKPAWRNSYKAVEASDSLVYTAIDTNLKTRYIAIVRSGNQITKISIVNFTKNMLYQTKEKLDYYPDSAYQIDKHQTVRILGSNNYLIKGRFNKLKQLHF